MNPADTRRWAVRLIARSVIIDKLEPLRWVHDDVADLTEDIAPADVAAIHAEIDRVLTGLGVQEEKVSDAYRWLAANPSGGDPS